jgi:hypothetical protein
MSSAEVLFRRLLTNLRPALAKNNFRRKGQNFICESSECWGIINFQKSRFSPTAQKSFTINLAIAAKRILAFYGEKTDAPPPAYAGHWVIRIGALMADRCDKWWNLSGEASYGPVEEEVIRASSDLAVPIIKSHMTEDGLLELWESENPGIFEYPRLKYKSVLLVEQGKFDLLPETFRRIREICEGGLAEAGAEQHIALIKSRFSVQ